MFSPQKRNTVFYDDQLRGYLDRLGAGEITIERTEYGVIPMDDRRRDQRWGRHLWNLGTVGGMTKPTSGYTFQRIHAQARHLIGHWANGATPTPLPLAPHIGTDALTGLCSTFCIVTRSGADPFLSVSLKPRRSMMCSHFSMRTALSAPTYEC